MDESERENPYRIMVENAPDAIVVHREGRFLYANHAALLLLGAEDFEQLACHAVMDFFRQEEREQAVERMRAATALDKLPIREARLRRLDGEEVIVEFHTTAINFRGVRAIQTIVYDISERKRAEEEVRSLARFPSENPNPVLRVTTDGRLLYANAASGPLLTTWGCRVGACLPDEWVRHVGDTLATRAVREVELICRENRIILCVLAPVPEAGYVNVYGRDVTEVRQAEKALRENEERFRLVLDRSPVVVAQVDRDLCYTWIHNPLAGIEPTDVLGKRIGILTDSESTERTRRVLGEVVSTGTSAQWETTINRPIGDLTYQSYAEPLRDDHGLIIGASVISVDITERKRAEEELRRAKENLALKVSERTSQLDTKAHQLRALAGELTLTEQRERRRLAKILHDHVQQILVAGKFRLLVLSRGADELTKQGIKEVEELIDESIRVSRSLTAELSPPILHEAGLNAGLEWLAKKFADTHDLFVDLNLEQIGELPEALSILLFEATSELLFNAAKHAEVRSVCLSLRRIAGALQLGVSDQGVGFDPEALPPAGESGGGFGLFGIRERIHLLGGNLEIQSAPGQGSRFIVTVPIEDASIEEISPRSTLEKIRAKKVPLPASDKRIRLMIADDHAIFRQGLVNVLGEEPDIEVVGQATNGREAFNLAAKLLPDVVLMDVSLPVLNGVEATRMIRNEFAEICIIGLSMFEEAERAQAMRDAGASDYLTKSGPIEELVNTIRRNISTVRNSCSKGDY